MSHTTKGPDGTVFHHNGDYSGDLDIVVRREPKMFATPEGPTAWVVSVPFADIRSLVLSYLRDKRTGELEDAEGDELEKLLFC
jgi:hypothetical protein